MNREGKPQESKKVRKKDALIGKKAKGKQKGNAEGKERKDTPFNRWENSLFHWTCSMATC